MPNKVTELSKEDLAVILNAKNTAISAAQNAEKVVAQAKVAELEHRTIVQHIFIKNHLDIKCTINEETGIITWPEEEVVAEEEAK